MQEDELARDDFEDVDQLRIGNDGVFMLTFFSQSLFVLLLLLLLLFSLTISTSPSSSSPLSSGLPLQLDRVLPLLLSHHLGGRPLRSRVRLRPLAHQVDPHCAGASAMAAAAAEQSTAVPFSQMSTELRTGFGFDSRFS